MKYSELPQDEVVKGEIPPSFAGVVTLRTKKVASGKASSGNRQITWVTEIASPDVIEWNNAKYSIAGQEITFYLGLELKTAKSTPLKKTFALYERLGLGDEIDQDNPNLAVFDNLHVRATVKSFMEFQQGKNPVTGEYAPIVDPETNEKVEKGWKWSCQQDDIIKKVAAVSEQGF